jgi:hypothetical protein
MLKPAGASLWPETAFADHAVNNNGSAQQSWCSVLLDHPHLVIWLIPLIRPE